MEGNLLNIKVNYATSLEFLFSTTTTITTRAKRITTMIIMIKCKRCNASLGLHLVTGSQPKGVLVTAIVL